MTSRLLSRATSTAVLIFTSAIAQAVPITWEASGVLNTVQNQFGTYLPFNANVGDAFAYRFTFEDTTSNSHPYDDVAIYRAITAASVTVGGITVDLPTIDPRSYISVQNDTGAWLGDPRDRLDVYADAGTDLNGYNALQVGLTLITPNLGGQTPLVFTSQDLPTIPPDVSQFALNSFSVQYLVGLIDTEDYFGYQGSWINGQITSLSQIQPASVPEPSTLALMALALGGIAVSRRRRTEANLSSTGELA